MSGEKSAQQRTAPYGLLGRKLGHSWSPQIHAKLGSVPYELHEVEPEGVEDFIRNGAWRGINVTMPYKLDAARLADERSSRVERLGAANTLVRRADGTIFADNTDVLGFAWMLSRFCEKRLGASAADVLVGEKALVLGSGGASKAIVAALEDAGAQVVVISRTGDDNYQNLVDRHADAVLLVNTTPVGMYPNCPATPVAEEDLARLSGLRGVLDIVYNPTRTGICLAAEHLGLPYESGLAMLVAQAVFSSELFQDTRILDDVIENVMDELLRGMENIVLIGMPGAGKTSTGKRLARMLGRGFVDIDDAILADTGTSSADIIRERGEAAFREVESEITNKYCSRSGLVIACGGGVVTRECNRDALRQNSRVLFIDRPLGELSSKGRPMSQAKGVERLAAERMDAYRSWCDATLTCTGSADGDASLARELLGL